MRRLAPGLASFLCGCSVFMTVAPENAATVDDFECTDSALAPTIDVSIATAYTIAGVVALAAGEPEIGVAFIGGATVEHVVARHGFGVADYCEDAKAERARRQRAPATDAAPPQAPLTPPAGY